MLVLIISFPRLPFLICFNIFLIVYWRHSLSKLSGISSGEVNITYVGNREYCHYVTLGRAVESVNRAEGQCVSGDIVVSPAAWCHCAGMPIEHRVLDDGKHVKVGSLQIGAMWKYRQINYSIIYNQYLLIYIYMSKYHKFFFIYYLYFFASHIIC